mmetsp:Transcript_89511/g.208468  ORF Transcript_89511/g.208468 Transcript_89511/m.208468 type:complete len:89 (+) Transcript_89511:3-269(+)
MPIRWNFTEGGYAPMNGEMESPVLRAVQRSSGPPLYNKSKGLLCLHTRKHSGHLGLICTAKAKDSCACMQELILRAVAAGRRTQGQVC